MADGIALGLSLIIFVIYLAIFFILLEIKSRTKNDLSKAFTYILFAVIILIILRITSILNNFGIFTIKYLTESLALALAFFLLMFFIKFYRSLCCVTDKKGNPRKNKR